MTTSNKFLFDTEFNSDGTSIGQDSNASQPPIYSEEQMGELKAQAFEEGLKQAQAASSEGLENAVAETLEKLNAQMQQLVSNHGTQIQSIKQDAAVLAMTVAGKIAPALIQMAPHAEVSKLIEDCLSDLHNEPRVVVRTSEENCDLLGEKIDGMAARAGFQGNIIMLPDPALTASDCRVEWADGGVERKIEEIQHRLNSIIDGFTQPVSQPATSS